jgi:hypothetical protein
MKEAFHFFECTCGEQAEVRCDNWREAWAAAKAAGWRCHKVEENVWIRQCPKCVRAFAARKHQQRQIEKWLLARMPAASELRH